MHTGRVTDRVVACPTIYFLGSLTPKNRQDLAALPPPLLPESKLRTEYNKYLSAPHTKVLFPHIILLLAFQPDRSILHSPLA